MAACAGHSDFSVLRRHRVAPSGWKQVVFCPCFILPTVLTMTPLRQRLIDDMQLRNRSPMTIKAYVRYVGQFAKHFGRSPNVLPLEHARQYQLHLLRKKVSWSTYNQSVCALRFLYGITLGRKDVPERLPFGKKPRRIPVVLSREEVLKFLQCIKYKQRMVLTTMYAAGGCAWGRRCVWGSPTSTVNG